MASQDFIHLCEQVDTEVRGNQLEPNGASRGKGESFLPGVKLKDNESFEGAMKRFKKQCEKAGLMYELRKREHYEKPSVRRKRKAMAARKRALKKLRHGQ